MADHDDNTIDRNTIGRSRQQIVLDSKSEAATSSRTPTNNVHNGNFTDSSLTDLFASMSEVNVRLQKVEILNKKLKDDRKQLILQLSEAEKSSAHQKEEFSKVREQLSCTFQENCRLKEDNALLMIDSKNLEKQMQQLQEVNKKLESRLGQIRCQLAEYSDLTPPPTIPFLSRLEPSGELSRSMPDNLKATGTPPLTPATVEKLKVLEKRHSSPQFFPNKDDSVEEISEKMFSQMMQEKQELEQQYNQMVEITRGTTESNPASLITSDFSFLGVDCPNEEKELLQYVDKCKQGLHAVKSDLRLMNFTLKYMLHVATSRKDEGASEGASLAASICNKSVVEQQHSSASSTPRTLVDSLEVQGFNPNESHVSRVVPAEEKRNTVETKTLVTPGNIEQMNLSAQEFCPPQPSSRFPPSSHRLENRPSHFQFAHKNHLDPSDATLLQDSVSVGHLMRSESAEANAGSPPSSLLTPDSLASCRTTTEEAQFPSSVSPVINNEDRVCPMCQAVFPRLVPQDVFEKHVVDHFDMEEFELLNI